MTSVSEKSVVDNQSFNVDIIDMGYTIILA